MARNRVQQPSVITRQCDGAATLMTAPPSLNRVLGAKEVPDAPDYRPVNGG